MPIDREKVLQTAQRLADKRRYESAIAECQKLVQEEPNDARILLKIGDFQAQGGQALEAIATYERVGQLYAAQGATLKALAVYKLVRELIAKEAPEVELQYRHVAPAIAALFHQLGQIHDAVATLGELAIKLQSRAEHSAAIELRRQIVSIDPTNAHAHLQLAEALVSGGDAADAAHSFAAGASQLLHMGRQDDALHVMERLLHVHPDAAHARIAAELYLDRAGPHDGMHALGKLKLCFQATPRDLATLALLARAFDLIGQHDKAAEVRDEMATTALDQQATAFEETSALTADPGDIIVDALEIPVARFSSPDGDYMVPRGREDDSAQYVSQGPSRIEATLEEAEFFMSRGLVAEAIAIVRQRLAAYPDHPLLLERLYDYGVDEIEAPGSHHDVDDDDEIEELDLSLAIDESTGGDLGNAQEDSSVEDVDVNEVFAQFKRAASHEHDSAVGDAEAHHDLGVAYHEMGFAADAIREFRLAARDEEHACVALSMVGVVELGRGRVGDAIAAFEQALALPSCTGEQTTAILYELGAAYDAKGEVARARDYYRQAAERDASFRDVTTRLEQMSQL